MAFRKRFSCSRAKVRPLSLDLIIDVSGSQDKFLKQHDRDVETFLKTVLRPKDQVFAEWRDVHLEI
jgi:Ca-activated chloride channel homolog